MGACKAKHQVQLAEWNDRIAACRSSGKSVTKWCAEAGINTKTYYRWEREVLWMLSQKLVSSTQQPTAFVELPRQQSSNSGIAAQIQLRGQTVVEIMNGADRETLAALLQVLQSC